MTIIHVVMFQFKPDTDKEVVKDACDRMLALKTKCIHPETQSTYITRSIGGLDNSIEGRQAGITHVFVSEFENEADRKYYVQEDPAHRAFVEFIGKVVVKAQVVDFTPGAF